MNKFRLYGLLILIAAIAATYYEWYVLLHEGYYYRKWSVLAPLVGFIGFTAILFPSLVPWEPPISKMQKFFGVIILIIGGAIGFINLSFIEGDLKAPPEVVNVLQKLPYMNVK